MCMRLRVCVGRWMGVCECMRALVLILILVKMSILVKKKKGNKLTVIYHPRCGKMIV